LYSKIAKEGKQNSPHFSNNIVVELFHCKSIQNHCYILSWRRKWKHMSVRDHKILQIIFPLCNKKITLHDFFKVKQKELFKTFYIKHVHLKYFCKIKCISIKNIFSIIFWDKCSWSVIQIFGCRVRIWGYFGAISFFFPLILSSIPI
jgi:hypothetical protein